MSRCGCGNECSCLIEPNPLGDNCIETAIEGIGTARNPYHISSHALFDPDSDDCLNCGDDGFLLVIDPDPLNVLNCGTEGLMVQPPPRIEDLAFFSRDEEELTVGSGTSPLMFPFAITVLGVSAAVTTAPTGADIILDVNMGGTTIFTTQANRPRVVTTATNTVGEAVPAITAIPAFSHITLDRDQVGSTIPGGPLTVFLRYERP